MFVLKVVEKASNVPPFGFVCLSVPELWRHSRTSLLWTFIKKKTSLKWVDIVFFRCLHAGVPERVFLSHRRQKASHVITQHCGLREKSSKCPIYGARGMRMKDARPKLLLIQVMWADRGPVYDKHLEMKSSVKPRTPSFMFLQLYSAPIFKMHIFLDVRQKQVHSEIVFQLEITKKHLSWSATITPTARSGRGVDVCKATGNGGWSTRARGAYMYVSRPIHWSFDPKNENHRKKCFTITSSRHTINFYFYRWDVHLDR